MDPKAKVETQAPPLSKVEQLAFAIENLTVPEEVKEDLLQALYQAEQESHDALWSAVESVRFNHSQQIEEARREGRDESAKRHSVLKHKILDLERQNVRLVETVEALIPQVGIDSKTKLYTGEFFNGQLDEILRRPETQRLVVVVFADFRKFKRYNDEPALGGYPVGDKVLIRSAWIMRRILRPIDFPSRFGGEEFMFLLANTASLPGAVEIIQRFKDAVENFKWAEHEDARLALHPPMVDVGGVAVYKQSAVGEGSVARIREELKVHAQNRMKEAKNTDSQEIRIEEFDLIDDQLVSR